MDEVEIVTRMQQGDREAFDVLFERYKNQALRTAYLITGNRSSSEDLVQEAFISCYFKINKLKDPAQFKAWFFKMLTRMAWRLSGKEKKIVPVDTIYEQADLERMDDAVNRYERDQNARYLYEAINKLPTKQKTVIVLYYFNGFSVEEIAGIMGCLSGTVKSRLHTARKNLQLSVSRDVIGEKGCETHGQFI